jgi:4-aminobutyrate aminotransferase-like enzyme
VFISEPLVGNAGGVCLPQSYLSQIYRLIHQIGSLVICDEVQTGYGRLGVSIKENNTLTTNKQQPYLWGFQSPEHELAKTLFTSHNNHDGLEAPDIITMAKAAGNGFPIGYVITRKSLFKEFHTIQGSFFSSAGGAPVASTVGSMVLHLVQTQSLPQHAYQIGLYFSQALRNIQAKYPSMIGYIHGYGLYQGIEIIGNSQWKEKIPGQQEANAICTRMLEYGIIDHNTGDYSNVLKIKPPLCLSLQDAQYYVQVLEEICQTGW